MAQLADDVTWLKELDFVVRYEVEDYRVRFYIYEVEGVYNEKPLYLKPNSKCLSFGAVGVVPTRVRVKATFNTQRGRMRGDPARLMMLLTEG